METEIIEKSSKNRMSLIFDNMNIRHFEEEDPKELVKIKLEELKRKKIIINN